MNGYSNAFIDSITSEHADTSGDTTGKAPILKLSLRELCEQNPRLQPVVIDGLLRTGETMNVISGSKIGKSWLVYSLLLSIATGRDWLDTFRTTPGRVLLIDNELHRPTIAGRIQAVAAAMGIEFDEVADRIEIWPLRGRLRDLQEIGYDLEQVEYGEFQLVVVDAWYRAIPRDTSENDNAAVAGLYNLIDRYAELMGAAFACVHHSSKGSQGEKRVTDVGAGAGSQSRAADCHLVLREHEDPDAVVLDGAVRSFPPVSPIVLRWTFPIWTPDAIADPEALKGRKKDREEKQHERDREAQNELLDVIGSDAMVNRAIRDRTGWSRDRVERIAGQLTKAGFLEVVDVTAGNKPTTGWRKTAFARENPIDSEWSDTSGRADH